jgi:hypothetical protein
LSCVDYPLELDYLEVKNVTSPKKIEIEHFKASFYSPWKELSNAIPNTSIRVDLTFENAKIVKLLVGLAGLSKLLVCQDCRFVMLTCHFDRHFC